jgi:hypothetical protein
MMPRAVKVLQPRWRKVGGGAKWISSGILLWFITAISVAHELPSGGALSRRSGGVLAERMPCVISALLAVIVPPNLRTGSRLIPACHAVIEPTISAGPHS